MTNPSTQAYETGNGVIAGDVQTDWIPLAADTYYAGMALKYTVTPTATGPGTGTGTCTLLSADSRVVAGDWTLDFSAALIADLKNPSGEVVASDLQMVDGDAAAFNINGLKFTITDGGTAFTSASAFTITVGTGGNYAYTSDLSVASAIYNGETKTLSTAGYGFGIMGGAIVESGIVDGSGTVITLTEATRAQLRDRGFYVKRKA